MISLEQFRNIVLKYKNILISINYFVLCSLIVLSLLADMNGRLFTLSEKTSFISVAIISVAGFISSLVLLFSDSDRRIKWFLLSVCYMLFALHMLL